MLLAVVEIIVASVSCCFWKKQPAAGQIVPVEAGQVVAVEAAQPVTVTVVAQPVAVTVVAQPVAV